MSESRYLRLIDTLVRHDVRFIIVGGMAAVLQRAPILTEDMDIVHDRAPDNVERLVLALAELNADFISELTPGGGYADLVPFSDLVDVGGRSVRVLTLEKLIEIKRQLPRPKDKLMLIHLEATLEEREKNRRDGE